jgi:putative mRNA 3-end processing factor
MNNLTGSTPEKDVLIRPQANDRWPRGIAYEGGFRVLGTPLGFGLARGGTLKYISHVDEPLPGRGERILVTPFAAAAMDAESRGFDSLILDYGRKIRLGRMDIRLFPSGLGLGSSQFEISFKDSRILYCGGVRLAQPLSAPPADFPRCDLLLLDVKPAEPRPPSPRRVADQIKEWTKKVIDDGCLPVFVCGTLGAAFDLAWTLRMLEVPIRAVRPLFEMFRRVENFGFSIGGLRRLERPWPLGDCVIHLERLWKKLDPAMEKNTRVAFVGPGRQAPEWADTAFRLGEGEDRPGLVSYVKQTGATQVALGANCDEMVARLLSKAGINIYRVQHPTQMPLPL